MTGTVHGGPSHTPPANRVNNLRAVWLSLLHCRRVELSARHCTSLTCHAVTVVQVGDGADLHSTTDLRICTAPQPWRVEAVTRPIVRLRAALPDPRTAQQCTQRRLRHAGEQCTAAVTGMATYWTLLHWHVRPHAPQAAQHPAGTRELTQQTHAAGEGDWKGRMVRDTACGARDTSTCSSRHQPLRNASHNTTAPSPVTTH